MRWLILVMCMLPAVARADDLADAQQFVAQMQYPQALKVVDRVLNAATSGPADLARAYQVRGIALAAMGRNAQAVDAFRRMLAIDPAMQLPGKISPKLRKPFDDASRLALGQKPITLVHTPPAPPKMLGGQKIEARLEANPLGMVRTVRLVYLQEGKPVKQPLAVKAKSPLVWRLPAKLALTRIEYFFDALNSRGGVLARASDGERPFALAIEAAAVVAAAAPADAAEEKRVEKAFAAEAITAVAVPPAQPDLSTQALQQSAQPQDQDTSRWYASWWFWTGVGVVAAGVAAGVVLAASSSDTEGALRYEVVLR